MLNSKSVTGCSRTGLKLIDHRGINIYSNKCPSLPCPIYPIFILTGGINTCHRLPLLLLYGCVRGIVRVPCEPCPVLAFPWPCINYPPYVYLNVQRFSSPCSELLGNLSGQRLGVLLAAFVLKYICIAAVTRCTSVACFWLVVSSLPHFLVINMIMWGFTVIRAVVCVSGIHIGNQGSLPGVGSFVASTTH